jgi:hypothetical protein
MLEYLSYFECARKSVFKPYALKNFSSPTDEKGYNDFFVTSDMITDLYVDFTVKVRRSESIEYCKTRTGKKNLDNRFI